MSVLEIFRALGDGHLPGRAKSRTRAHQRDEDRSDAWNAWRERQALQPHATPSPVRPVPPKRAITPRERQARRLSSRSSRRRASRNSAGA